MSGLKKGKKLKLFLHSDEEIFSQEFDAKAVHQNGSESAISIKKNEFFRGTVEGNKDSFVLAYWEGSALHATIETPEDTLIIEPAWRHDDGTEDIREDSMLVYYASNIKEEKNLLNQQRDSPSFCGAIHVNSTETVNVKQKSFMSERSKRQTSSQNTCRVLLVADYKYFSSMGGGDLYRTATYLVSVIERVNTIYRSTVFSASHRGFGLEVAEIRIHDSPTEVSSGTVHYNMVTSAAWDASTLLKTFSQAEGLSSFCLAHLFTSQSFSNNVLGLAYIAPPNSYSLGGICTSPIGSSGAQTTYNTGFTTSMNVNGDQLLRQQSDLVTAHEFGHNWGSEHDPGSGDCSPTSSFGGDGKYLMYPYSVTGYDKNNHLFSDCSKNYISKALSSRSPLCFQERKTTQTLCGNGLLDDGEECDGGFLGSLGVDRCCDSQCKLTPGSTCSPLNSECCVNCLTAPVGWSCYTSTGENCLKDAFCDGTSTACPTPENKDDGSKCLDEGECENGVCLSFCKSKNLTSCICSEVGDSCKRCCKNVASGDCVPYSPVSLLPDGRTCINGYCSQGTCKKTNQNLIERLFDLIQKIDLDLVLEAIRTNVVSFIVAITLIVWIPVSCIISYRDRKRKREWEKRMNIEIRRDRELVFDQDKRKVVRPKEFRTPRVSRPPNFSSQQTRA